MTAPNVQESEVSATRFGLVPLTIGSEKAIVVRLARLPAPTAAVQFAVRSGAAPAMRVTLHGSWKPGAKFGTSGKPVSETFGARTARL